MRSATEARGDSAVRAAGILPRRRLRPRNLNRNVPGLVGPFFMARQFDRERELHRRIQAVLDAAVPQIEAIEVELNDPQEKVTVYIDGPDGIGLEHCEAVTHAIRDTCPDHELEVSSPGLERPLRSPASFRAAMGEQVRLRHQGHHRAALVRIVDVDDVHGLTVQADGGATQQIAFDDVIRCRLVVTDPFAAAAARRKEQA